MRKGAIYRRSGSWAYRVDIAPDPKTGKRQQCSRQGFRIKAEAIAALGALIANTEPPRPTPSQPVTVRQVARCWVDRNTHVWADATVAPYRRSVNNICDRLGDTVIKDLTVAMVDEFERDLFAHGSAGGGALSPNTVHGVHSVLHQILDDALRRTLLERNVAANASPPRYERTPASSWSTGEVRTFLSTARTHRLHPAFVLMLATGLTRGELVGLHWADIDLDDGSIVGRTVSMTLGI